jgi:hypothetical protein
LLEEHGQLQKDFAQLGNILFSYEIEKSILENNLYGVDINREAVEIAKLSLWLRTASRGRSLTSLANKIKVGNSLIDDKSIDNNAFVWKEEFSEVFERGGFDIIIGNPPYGAKLSKEHQNYMKNKYNIGSSDTAPLFIKLSNDILKENGILSFIIPKPFSFSSSYTQIRELLWNELSILVDCGKVWSNVKLEQNIFVSNKNILSKKYDSLILKKQNFIKIATIDKDIAKDYGFFLSSVSNREINLGLKIKRDKWNLLDISKANWGDTFFKNVSNSGDTKVLAGANIQRYRLDGIKGKVYKDKIKLSNNAFIRDNSILLQRLIAHIQNPIDHIKIIGTISPNFKDYLILNTIQQITLKKDISNKFILAILHSKLMNWYIYRFIFAKAIRTFQFSNDVIKKIPIPNVDKEQQKLFIEKINLMFGLTNEFQKAKYNFLDELELEKISKKLQNFENLNFNEFIKEYKKAKKLKFTNKLEERNFKNEWRDLFENDKKISLELKEKIDRTDREIDKMVYELYGLSEEEIGIIENGVGERYE